MIWRRAAWRHGFRIVIGVMMRPCASLSSVAELTITLIQRDRWCVRPGRHWPASGGPPAEQQWPAAHEASQRDRYEPHPYPAPCPVTYAEPHRPACSGTDPHGHDDPAGHDQPGRSKDSSGCGAPARDVDCEGREGQPGSGPRDGRPSDRPVQSDGSPYSWTGAPSHAGLDSGPPDAPCGTHRIPSHNLGRMYQKPGGVMADTIERMIDIFA